MPHDFTLILTLTGGLTSALVLGLLTQKLRMSPIVGYLLAGVLIGPFTPGFVADAHIAEQFAELGVILLMFGVGLHFHLADLLAVRRVAIPGALVQIAAATGLGVLLAWGFDWSLGAGLVFGLAISVASTVVLLRVLSDNGTLHTSTGHVAVGWLIVEDLFTVLVLVLLPVVAGNRGGGGAADVAGPGRVKPTRLWEKSASSIASPSSARDSSGWPTPLLRSSFMMSPCRQWTARRVHLPLRSDRRGITACLNQSL